MADAKRISERLRQTLDLLGLSESAFTEDACLNHGFDSRTIQKYLRGTGSSFKDGKIHLIEQKVLGVPRGTLSGAHPIEQYLKGVESHEALSFEVDEMAAGFLNPREFELFAEWDQASYDTVPNYENRFFVQSYYRYPKGVIGLFESKILHGGLEIWPLAKGGVALLKAGKIASESEFMPDQIFRGSTPDWYIGGLLKGPSSHSNLGLAILQKCLAYWNEKLQADRIEPFTIWSIPVRDSVKRYAALAGFQRVSRGLGNHPIMFQTFRNSEVFLDWIDDVLPEIFERAVRLGNGSSRRMK